MPLTFYLVDFIAVSGLLTARSSCPSPFPPQNASVNPAHRDTVGSPGRVFPFLCHSFLFLLPVQFSSVAQLCPTLCDPMNRSMPGLPVHHQFPEFTQTHVHRVRDAIQPSHPRSSPSPPAPNPSQHQSLFQ